VSQPVAARKLLFLIPALAALALPLAQAAYRRELLTEPPSGTVAAALQGKLRTAGFIGGSIDVTALPNLRTLFGKAGPAPAPPVSAPAQSAPNP
jgi:hypothetical protein